ncbi:MAG: protein-L-isoaspartate(D-aspartate) O-methyltransferase, partial [Spirochaetota bacterium]|nr:protein-L-isoaspartate(D-aspartate) O-methyltransferase [Spirochaetota bacterium]
DAMLKVKRHHFVLPEDIERAYGDHPLPIGYNQTISQPYMVAVMTENLELTDEMSVLEIGTGSGYQTAILAEIARIVYSVERIPELAIRAKTILKSLNYENIDIKVGDGSFGLEEYAPYDRIIVTAGASRIPAPLVNQLRMYGIMAIPVGDRWMQTLYKVHKIPNTNSTTGYDLEKTKVEHCIFVPLIGDYA